MDALVEAHGLPAGALGFEEGAGEPGSNVRIVPVPALVPRCETDVEPAEPGWAVVHGDGHRQRQLLHSRGEAVRLMSRLALCEHSVLPLRVVDPLGHPTGDRLA